MPLRPEMWGDITAAIGSAVNANLSAASAGNDLYECYIWALVLEAARREGATIRLMTRSGAPATSFYFRTSPTSIFSDLHDYCHAEIRFPRSPVLEAHIGIYVSGKSRVNHECDVAVIYGDEANTCRANRVNPRSSKILLSVECKYFLSSNLGINLGRSFLGLVDDIYAEGRFFVSTQNAGSVDKLFSRHRKEYEIGLSPLGPDQEIRLRGSFEKIFRNFQAR
ncbi:hypothetical protein FJ546_13285 [Mesorhizobium sp. B2-4-19]|uniref:hypothetical protein n=1 Tax=Mesorhizobium sp. B2-4-19 TaxID=2589930 RepID=UPI001129F65A|nr:hypothetical protein [Mesorhizobium sp. B2-4-19]TPK63692.1 hypothetical protein FJ546_13285 [Mesorhizobium sp. B2-4-19]